MSRELTTTCMIPDPCKFAGMDNLLDPDTCARLQQRLREAEARTTEALETKGGEESLRNATEQLLKTHREIRQMIQSAEKSPEQAQAKEHPGTVEQAAIATQREEHELKPEFKDVLKAIFMWKDDPRERAQDP